MSAGKVVRLDGRKRVSVGRFTEAEPGALFEITNEQDAIVLRRVYIAPRPTGPFDGTELEVPPLEETAA